MLRTVANNGTLVFNRSNALTIANAISGSGTLTQMGAGALSLTGVSSIAAINNQSAISTLTNARGGTGTTALSYTGALPSNYFVYVTSATQYGQLNVSSSTGSLNFGLASSSTLGAGAYTNVITGLNNASVGATRSGIMNGFMWKLVLANASASTWNLVVSSATLAPGATQSASNLVDNVDLAFQGSSLRIDRPGVINNNMRVDASTGNTIDLSANTATFSGVISDSGSGGAIGFSGGGTAIVTGANTYTGATAIDAGTTVQVGDGGTIGSLGTGAVVANGTIVVNRTDNITVANNISGAGGLTVAGSGVTTLSGVNTFSGGLVVNSGATVAIPSSAALGTGLLALVGSPTVPATLKVTGTTTISNALTVSGDPVFNIAAGTTTTITSPITDGLPAGDVVVLGGGTLALTAVNTYTGLTSVAAGSTLALQGAGAMANSVSVTNNGVVDLTGLSGATTMGGTFTQASTGSLLMTMTASGPRSFTIGGAASLDGALTLTAAPGAYRSGTYRLLTAGSLAGTFSSFSTNMASFARLYSLSYTSTTVDLVLVAGRDAANTTRAMAANSANLRNLMNQRTAALSGMMDYDCATFDTYGVCLSFQARYGAMDTLNDGAGVLTAAVRLSPHLRLGGFIDQAATRNAPTGLRQNAQPPSFGAFVGFNQRADGLGLQGRISAAMNRGDLRVTRDASLAETEAGSGKSRLAGAAVAAELGYGIAWAGTLRATPYMGFRFTDVSRAAYGEDAVSGTVDNPIAYAALHQRLGTASLGLRLNGMASDRIGYQLGMGVDYYAFSAASAYVGVSGIYGLEAFALPGASLGRRASPVGSAAIFYQIDRTRRLTGHVSVRGQAFSSQTAVSVMGGYQAAF